MGNNTNKKIGGWSLIPMLLFVVIYIVTGLNVLVTLAALSGFTVSPLDVIPFLWYQWLLAAALIVSFFVPFADGVIKKHPWNWETGKAEK